MRLRMGSQNFQDVTVPLLWGTRAVLQDRHGRISIVDLGGERANLEIVGDTPAPGVEYRPTVDGFVIMVGAEDLYQFDPTRHKITPLTLDLPECEITPHQTRIGSSIIANSSISGFGVGIRVTPGGGMAIGAPLPPGLAALDVA